MGLAAGAKPYAGELKPPSNQRIFSVECAPDGRHALLGSWDSEASVWDIHTGECLLRTADKGTRHKGGVMAASWVTSEARALRESRLRGRGQHREAIFPVAGQVLVLVRARGGQDERTMP